MVSGGRDIDLGLVARYLVLRRQLRSRERWSPDRLHLHQRDALRELRGHAMARSPFYRRFHARLEGRPLAELPVLTEVEAIPRTGTGKAPLVRAVAARPVEAGSHEPL